MKAVIVIIIIIVVLLVFDACWNIFVYDEFPSVNNMIRDFIMCAIVAGVLFVTSVHVTDGFLFMK